MFLAVLVHKLFDLTFLLAVADQAIEDTLLVKVEHLKWGRFLRELHHTSNLVKVVKVVPESEKLASLEPTVQVSCKLGGEAQSADSLKVLEQCNYHLLLHSTTPSLIEETETVILSAVLVQCSKHSPKHVHF